MLSQTSRRLLRNAAAIAAAIGVALALRSLTLLSPQELTLDDYVLRVALRVGVIAISATLLALCLDLGRAFERSAVRRPSRPRTEGSLSHLSTPTAV